MASRRFELDLKGFAEFLRQRGQSLRSLDFTKPLQATAVLLGAATKENFAGGHSPDGAPWKPLARPRIGSKGNDKPLRDKGLLMASASARGARGHIEKIGRNSLQYGTNLEYAAIHQNGGTIRAKSGKYLALPLTKEARRVPGPRKFSKKLFVVRSKKGNLLLAQRDGNGIKPQYLLRASVTIPARPFIGLNQKTIDTIDLIFAEHVAKVIA